MPTPAELKKIAYVRKHPSKPGWFTVSPKECDEASVRAAWEVLARTAARVIPASYSLRFAQF